MENLLFFDIDGTLAQGHFVPESTKKVLNRIMNAEVPAFICSGRVPFYIQEHFFNLLPNFIGCNGRYVFYQGKAIFKKPFSKEEIQQLMSVLEKNGFGALFLFEDGYYPFGLSAEEIEGARKMYRAVHEKTQLDGEVLGIDPYYHSYERFNEFYELLKDQFIISDHFKLGHCDLSSFDFDKGSAIHFIQEYFETTKQHLYCFGDGDNDMPMFRESGNRIAMGNAIDALKKKASYITDEISHDGIQKAIEAHPQIFYKSLKWKNLNEKEKADLLAWLEKTEWKARHSLHDKLRDGFFEEKNAEFLLLKNDKNEYGGYIGIADQDEGQSEHAPYACYLYIAPHLRGHKAAGLLLEEAEACTKKNGLNHISVLSDMDGFYERYGYKKIKDLPDGEKLFIKKLYKRGC